MRRNGFCSVGFDLCYTCGRTKRNARGPHRATEYAAAMSTKLVLICGARVGLVRYVRREAGFS
jgi:hypothetical protein